ncbi:DUF2971 domain-containing protein [Agaribacterium sp. ZY112]|uniref:DUF2971 domain-containing protein n=1 Tax=Agaribacterium sp. ZY112 TaxID=3233574 RepID=UPI003525A9FF
MKVPETLYKYTTASTANIVLESGRLRWSNPSQFNDLHEFKIMPVFSPGLDQDWDSYLLAIVDIAYSTNSPDVSALSPHTLLLLALLKQLKSTVTSKQELFNVIHMNCPSDNSAMEGLLRNFTESIKNEYSRVFCLTSSPTNELMWAHYASSHTGCVLGFKHLEDMGTPFAAAKPVKYSEGNPVIGTGKDFLLYGETRELRQKTIEAIFYTKQISWAYENEWRVITWRYNELGKDFGDYKFYSEELESVTFGARIESHEKRAIINIMEEKYSSAKMYDIVSENGQSERILINS